MACENGHLDVVVFLEKNGAMPSTWSMLSIVDIAAKGDLVGAEHKIMHKANLNQVGDMRNNTALMLASKKGLSINSQSPEGANTDAKNIDGYTALMLASMNDRQELLASSSSLTSSFYF